MTAPAVSSLNFDARMTGPYTDLKTVTPADGSDLPISPARGLYVTAAGNVKVTTQDGTAIVVAVAQYQDLPLVVTRVWSTSTTATVLAAY